MLSKICELIVGKVGKEGNTSTNENGDRYICLAIGTETWYLVPFLPLSMLRAFYIYYVSLTYLKPECKATRNLFEKSTMCLYWRTKPEMRIDLASTGQGQLTEEQRGMGITDEDLDNCIAILPHPKRWKLYTRFVITR